LNRAGYPLLPRAGDGQQSALVPLLPDWISGFDEWIHKSEPQEIMDLSIFFDFRTVYGSADLTHELRRTIHTALADEPAFFHHFCPKCADVQTALPPAGQHLPGRWGRHRTCREINLKDAMMPMVSFARLYALRHQINQTHTLERIEA
jgi:CBS domain-containing protein